MCALLLVAQTSAEAEVLRGCASAIPYCFSTIINNNAVIKIENIQEREIEKVNPEART